jgi:hypothetical protein
MDVDADILKKFVVYVLNGLKKFESELTAHQLTFLVFKQTQPMVGQLLDDALEAARISPALQQQMREKYDPVLESLQQAEQSDLDSELLKFLKKWKPTGLIN